MKFRGIKRLFRFPTRTREDVRDDIREEFQFHLDMRAEELRGDGLDDAAARAQARREFGDQASGAHGCAVHGDRIERRRWLTRFAAEFSQDVAFSLRVVARGPGLATVTVLTLAVAIGANATIFALVNALLFKPLPVAAPHQLARVKAGENQMAWANYEDIRRDSDAFEQLVAHRSLSVGLATADRPVRLRGQQTSDNFFVALGIPPALGRSYTPADARQRSRGAGGSSLAYPLRRRSVGPRAGADDRRPSIRGHRDHAAAIPGRGTTRVGDRLLAGDQSDDTRASPARSN